ncbi:hypothetical protein [Alkalicoccobacillus plakortidis]|uniref:Uncharacterized protein n=1 Tax=Alkalicoccobacillus plakortidis TaxID=444060 RepID=A0ABT0XH23_9BACI|nr:hypothetical protein [Alkalicoccobacillus plakortidis]MCM2675191.1 hypothetical protein [Alkalicoccobacillus plakortidis]
MGEDLVKDYSEDLHLNAQDQIRYQEMKTYLETKQLPNAIANQLLHTFQKQLYWRGKKMKVTTI